MKSLTTFLLLIIHFGLLGQIHLQNPSFEDEPQDATVPTDWLPCDELTTPDILPGYWSVYMPADAGDTYVGIITRSDGTWETIAQRLPQTLARASCYSMNFSLANSKTYEGYNAPAKLRIWGGLKKCDKDQLLFESPLIDHKRWKKYNAEFVIEGPVNYIIFEIFINNEYNFSAKSNILIDDISPLLLCPRT